jgi:hypothetical protein
MTINRDYFKGLKHFAKLFPDNIPWGSGLVYPSVAKDFRFLL